MIESVVFVLILVVAAVGWVFETLLSNAHRERMERLRQGERAAERLHKEQMAHLAIEQAKAEKHQWRWPR